MEGLIAVFRRSFTAEEKQVLLRLCAPSKKVRQSALTHRNAASHVAQAMQMRAFLQEFDKVILSLPATFVNFFLHFGKHPGGATLAPRVGRRREEMHLKGNGSPIVMPASPAC